MSQTSQKERLGLRFVLGSISRLALLSAFFVALTFVTAGRLDYWQGWVFNGLNVLFLLVSFIVLRDRKDLIKERQKPGKGMKKWDKICYLIITLLFLVMFITSVVDAGRFSRPPAVAFSVVLIACAVSSIGQLLVLWAKKANRYFSPVVRIQTDRGQTVCSDGPYRLIRHPGYLGGLISNMATPLVLGSYWGLIPFIFLMIPLVGRTFLEDKTLHEELTGYADYAQKVPFRLIPHIW
jgi:protein-S-isoprenylcysteine O-methyltransferase Ste14